MASKLSKALIVLGLAGTLYCGEKALAYSGRAEQNTHNLVQKMESQRPVFSGYDLINSSELEFNSNLLRGTFWLLGGAVSLALPFVMVYSQRQKRQA